MGLAGVPSVVTPRRGTIAHPTLTTAIGPNDECLFGQDMAVAAGAAHDERVKRGLGGQESVELFLATGRDEGPQLRDNAAPIVAMRDLPSEHRGVVGRPT